MASIKPLSDRVVVRPEAAEEKTESGLYIPDTAKIEMSVSAGDKVLYGKYSGTEISIDGEDLLIMREGDILGIVEG